jgi:5'-nucleotidase
MQEPDLSIVDISPQLPLVVGVSTRAMFDLIEEHRVFERDGLEAYEALQREREQEPLKPDAAFEVTRRLLALNDISSKPVVEVIPLSKNSPNLSLRAFNSLDYYQIPIHTGASSAAVRSRPSRQRGMSIYSYQTMAKMFVTRLLPE